MAIGNLAQFFLYTLYFICFKCLENVSSYSYSNEGTHTIDATYKLRQQNQNRGKQVTSAYRKKDPSTSYPVQEESTQKFQQWNDRV